MNITVWIVLIAVTILLVWHPWSKKNLVTADCPPKSRPQSVLKQKTGCCEKCGTYHPEPEESCPRENR